MAKLEAYYPMPCSQSIAQRIDGQSIVHFSAPINVFFQKDKYNKFAYTTWTGFDCDSLKYGENLSFGDNILAFSFDCGINWQMRHNNLNVSVKDNRMECHWSTGSIDITTSITVLPNGKSIREHHFTLGQDAWVVESGFAVGHWYEEPEIITDDSVIKVSSSDSISSIQSLDSHHKELKYSARVHTNVVHPRSSVPFLLTKLEAGKHVLKSEFMARKIS